MIIIDANLLLYAYNADAPQQPATSRWLSNVLDSGEAIGLPWVTIWAFLRICTNSRIWANPRSPAEAFAIISDWLQQPGVIAVQPGPRHAEILENLITHHGASGHLVTDAVLAALAIEYGASLASADHDFSRFSMLRWFNPLDDSK